MMNSRPTKRPDRRGPFKHLRKKADSIIRSNWFLLAVSLAAAVITWSVLVANDGTLTREKKFENVSVAVTGESALKTRGFIVMDDLESLLSDVDMTVEVTQSNYSRAASASYNPHVDLTDVLGVGENELPISFSSQIYGPVTECSPASITVNVERYITRRVPVVLIYSGTVCEGIYLDSARTDPTSLTVSGPQSIVSTIARVVARFDLSMLSSERMSDRIVVPIELQSTAGEVIISDKVQVTNQSVMTDSVIMEAELLPVKAVPLAMENFVIGEPAKGYELYGIQASQTHLSIAAKQEVLDAIDQFTTDSPLDITGATGDVAGTVRIKRPAGIENSVPYDVNVTAKIRETTVERTFRSVPVELIGVDDAVQAKAMRTSVTVQLSGAYTFINALEKDDIRLFADLNGLGEGEHAVPVQIQIDNAETFSCALSDPQITVKVTLRAE